MKQDANNTVKSTSDSKFRAYGIVTLCVLLILGLPSCRKRRSAPLTYKPQPVEVSRTQEPPKSPPPSPPDIRPCTRVDIHLLPSTLEWVCLTRNERNLLSREELEYLLDLKGITVKDHQQIQELAHELTSASYRGPVEPPPMIKEHVSIVCSQNNKYLTSFTVWGSRIMVGGGNEFQNERIWASILPMIDQIRPLQLRVRCAGKLRDLGGSLRYWPADNKEYPSPSEWCDAIVRKYQDKGTSKEYMSNLFRCPSVTEGECHYAINPDCKPDSPPDAVLLYETKAGWNQHGGPELFTFDNHDPKGGCVKLNDGTVKFIRTKKELQQLRWK